MPRPRTIASAFGCYQFSPEGEVWIDVEAGDSLSATVRDDGVGSDGLRFGSGLEGVRERLAEARGTLTVETQRGAGLTLRFELPAATCGLAHVRLNMVAVLPDASR